MEKTLAYNMLKELAFSILADKGRSNITLFQKEYLGKKILNKGKNKIEDIAKGSNFLTTDEAVELAKALRDTLDKGELIYDTGEPSENPPIPIPNLPAKKKIMQTVLSYFLEVHDIDTEIYPGPYTIIEGTNVTENDIRKTLLLDTESYVESGAYEDDSEAFDLKKCLNWFHKNNQTYTMIKDETGNIVGYINAVPVTDDCYNKIKQGIISDSQIKSEDILDYLLPGEYNLYFASIVIDKKKDRYNRCTLLWKAFIEKLIRLVKDDFIVNKVLAYAITSDGEMMCRSRMDEIKKTDRSTVYETVLYPSHKAKTREEAELYNLLFEKFKEKNINKYMR